MHLALILTALGVAWTLRIVTPQPTGSWGQRWQRALFSFIFPPLLLVMTALAVFWMGPQGEMLGLPASRFSYFLSLGFLTWTAASLSHLTYQGWRTQQQLGRYPQQLLAGKMARILDTPFPYSAVIGFWQPELVVSKGIVENLDSDHLEAVFAHEQAHCEYRDTFWFFWLGWLGSFTCWLPNTEILWQELLLLREMRADRRAADQADALLLAESLLAIAQHTQEFSRNFSPTFCAALNDTVTGNRLGDRIDALLTETDSFQGGFSWSWTRILLALLPLLSLPFHNSLLR